MGQEERAIVNSRCSKSPRGETESKQTHPNAAYLKPTDSDPLHFVRIVWFFFFKKIRFEDIVYLYQLWFSFEKSLLFVTMPSLQEHLTFS